MFARRALIIGGIILVLFLALYSWNRRTGVMDDFSSSVGLEITSWIIGPLRSVEDFVRDYWNRYFDLVDVRGENQRLKKRIDELEAILVSKGEDLAELERLRKLVQFPVDVRWNTLAARVLAGRMGPNSAVDSITISRGYANGARPGMPLVTNLGLVGRLLRSSAHASTAMLVSDPGSKVAVFGQESRATGILKGQGLGKPMEVDFVQRDGGMKEGEILITSGLDDKYPKGLPVARAIRVAPSDYTQFMAVNAVPLVNLAHLEEVLILEKSGLEAPEEEWDGPEPELVGPPLPEHLLKKRQRKEVSRNGDATATGSAETPPADQESPAAAPRSSGNTGTTAPSFRVITP